MTNLRRRMLEELQTQVRSCIKQVGRPTVAIQALLGHVDLETTARYLHQSQRHLQTVSNPLEHLQLSSASRVSRGYHRKRDK